MEILGLIDTLESVVLDSTKVPFTKKILVDEGKLLAIIDKIRLVIQGGSDFAKRAIVHGESGTAVPAEERPSATIPEMEGKSKAETKAVEVIEQAYRLAKEVREGADKYADEVLANIEATTTRVLRTVKAGRERLATGKNETD